MAYFLSLLPSYSPTPVAKSQAPFATSRTPAVPFLASTTCHGAMMGHGANPGREIDSSKKALQFFFLGDSSETSHICTYIYIQVTPWNEEKPRIHWTIQAPVMAIFVHFSLQPWDLLRLHGFQRGEGWPLGGGLNMATAEHWFHFRGVLKITLQHHQHPTI